LHTSHSYSIFGLKLYYTFREENKEHREKSRFLAWKKRSYDRDEVAVLDIISTFRGGLPEFF
jgi:hypothetical protein